MNMICQNCGEMLEYGVKFCGSCGAAQIYPVNSQIPSEESIPITATPSQTSNKYEVEPAVAIVPSAAGRRDTASDENSKNAKATLALVFGILSLVFSMTVILGIVMGATGNTVAKEYKEKYYDLSPKARVGKILSTVGMCASIGLGLFYVFLGMAAG